MKIRLPITLLAGLVFLLVLPAAALADEAESLYTTDAVNAIELVIPPSSITALEADPTGEYQPAEFKFAETDGTPEGIGTYSSPIPVKVRLKGHVGGSFEPITGKAAFKVKFKTPLFKGLKKMTLNNMVEDPSMIHEALTYTAFRAAGVPAPRTGYAFLRVNGEPYGVYLDIETLDKVALEKQLGPFDEATQHLYEGEYGADVVPGGAGAFEVDEGEEANRADLEALIEAVNAPSPPSYSERMAPVADLAELTKFWAIEKYVGRWDGYAGFHQGPNQPNNYYLYSDAQGRFQMLPWGSDETWQLIHKLPFDEPDGLMFNKCLEDEECAGAYWEAVDSTSTTIAGLPLDDLATELAALLEPWQELDPRMPTSIGQIADAVSEVQQFLAERPGEAAAWLTAHQPPEAEPEPPTGDSGGSSGSGGGSGSQAGASAPAGTNPAPISPPVPHPRARFHGPVSQSGRVLTLRTTTSAPGWLRLSGELETAAASGPTVCVGARHSLSAGSHRISCRITGSAWRKLRTESLVFVLKGSFEGKSGGTSEPTRAVEILRRGHRH
jgi:hypothetical protein